ncbi:MAG: pyruvate formate lyase-activating protein [Clostridiales bacterium]|nr:pyruvate formate lyase-activating protein [Clostridiales bacterium]
MIKGRISSVETMGTLDGPGIRFVVFLQGCKLRCKYCHNPETWAIDAGEEITPKQLIEKIKRYKSYFADEGGVTFSGGEPLLQPEFLIACLKLCKENNIHTALDTAGVGFGDYEEILSLTDLVILDVKAVDENEYKELTGMNIKYFYQFLSACERANVDMWIRQVIVPGLNDDATHIEKLKGFISSIKNVQRVELLPYKNIGAHKYKSLKIKYRLEGTVDMDEEKCKYLENLLK